MALQDSKVATARTRLHSLATEAEVLADRRSSDNAWDWLVVPRIRRLLELSVHVLAEIADDLDDQDGAARDVLATRDELAAHLRAADHVVAAQARPEALANLLLQAVDLLVDGATRLRD